jgi:hypothetical protein
VKSLSTAFLADLEEDWGAHGKKVFPVLRDIEKLEQRVGPQGRKLFEDFLRKVNKLQAQQHLEAQARTGDTERTER